MPRLMAGRYERVEVITGVARRRRWSAEEKLRMVNELSRPGATVSLVARRNDINSSLLFKWRKLAREGAFGALPDGDAGFRTGAAGAGFGGAGGARSRKAMSRGLACSCRTSRRRSGGLPRIAFSIA